MPASPKHDITITLRHEQPQNIEKECSRARSLDKTDLIPPKDVCRAELNSIQLELDILPIHELKQSEINARKRSQSRTVDNKLANQAKRTLDHANELVNAVRDLKDAIKIISFMPVDAMNFGQVGPNDSHTITKSLKDDGSNSKEELRHHHSPTSNAEASRSVRKNKKPRIPEETRHILNTWLQSHAHNPYPTASEKRDLMHLTSLTRSKSDLRNLSVWLLTSSQGQIDNWFSHNRKRVSPQQNACTGVPFLPWPEGIQFPEQDREEVLFSSAPENLSEEEVVDLLSEPYEDDTSRFSEISRVSTIHSPSKLSQATTVEVEQAQDSELNISALLKLVDGVLQILIGGYYRNIRLPPDIKLERPAPQICLAKLIPNMFNPGYREVWLPPYAHQN